jgi:YgiT-type zinc finger domain-containing protein
MVSGLQKEAAMKCSICGAAELAEGTMTLTFERESTTIVVKGVPGLVCPNCGEEHVSEDTASHALEAAKRAATNGSEVEVLHYKAA